MAKGRLTVKVEGLERAGKIPGWLEHGQRRTLELAIERIRDSIRSKAPGGAGGKVAMEVEGRTLTSTRGEITLGRIAKAHAKGAYIRSKRGPGTAIRFTVGGDRVFVRAPRGARLPATKFDTKGLRPRRRIIQQTFDEVMGDIERPR